MNNNFIQSFSSISATSSVFISFFANLQIHHFIWFSTWYQIKNTFTIYLNWIFSLWNYALEFSHQLPSNSSTFSWTHFLKFLKMSSINSSSVTHSINHSDDSFSPCYLYPSNNLGALLVSKIFNGNNYVVWSRSIVIKLTIKNKVQFIDCSIISPLSDRLVNHTAWLQANNFVLS